MSTLDSAILLVFSSVSLGFFAAALLNRYTKVREAKKTAVEQLREDSSRAVTSMAVLCRSVDQLTACIQNVDLADLREIVESLKAMPALMQGLTDLCKVEVDKTDTLNKAVDLLQSTIHPDSSSGGYEEYATETPAAIAAQNRQEVRDLMRREKISEEEAQKRVHERMIYEGLARGR